jgi:NADH pyrophosphatase NudC (nudix superfamily)
MIKNIKTADTIAPPLGDLGVDPINHYKFCPRCALPGNFDSIRNSFNCPSCGFHFFLNAAAAVTALIFDSDDKLLVVKRGIEPALGMLDLPGGFVDPGESAEHAIVREISEELNLTPSSITFFGSFPNKYPFSGCNVDTVDMVFTLKVDSFTGIKCMDDVADVEFLPLEEIDLDSIAFHSTKSIIKQLIDERTNS